MAEIEMTDLQIIEKLKTDIDFGLNFIVKNQPNIVIDRLKENGYDLADTPEKAYDSLVKLMQFDAKKVGLILNNIPYDNAVDNFTGGLDQYFPSEMPQKSIFGGDGGFSWGGMLSGLGAVLTGIGGATAGSTLTPQQQQALIEQQRLIEAERKRKQQNALIFGFIGLVLLIIVVVMYNASKKKAKK